MVDEMTALHSNGTWDLVSLPPGKSTVGCRWVYIIKVGPDGQLDIKNVFLHGELFEEVYMEQPPGFVAQGESGLVCKSFIFYHHNSSSQCIYLVVYVDDIVITGSDQEGIQRLKQHFFNHFQTKDLGKLKYFLGFEITHSSSGVVMSQRKYVLDILEETGMLEYKPVDTPMDPNVVSGQGESLRDLGRYRRLVGQTKLPHHQSGQTSLFLNGNNAILPEHCTGFLFCRRVPFAKVLLGVIEGGTLNPPFQMFAPKATSNDLKQNGHARSSKKVSQVRSSKKDSQVRSSKKDGRASTTKKDGPVLFSSTCKREKAIINHLGSSSNQYLAGYSDNYAQLIFYWILRNAKVDEFMIRAGGLVVSKSCLLAMVCSGITSDSELVPDIIAECTINGSVFWNGALHWKIKKKPGRECMLSFDVSSGKFAVTRFPVSADVPDDFEMVELDGHLSLVQVYDTQMKIWRVTGDKIEGLSVCYEDMYCMNVRWNSSFNCEIIRGYIDEGYLLQVNTHRGPGGAWRRYLTHIFRKWSSSCH
ncbi:Retrovirus-related Pol polyprotein from transposon RE1 [Vitis vinifera]|uniref:Retrovirus-related Pol polyprotein from transposon RE1 n=1 Tax=Vitis vinifera TaxID=29760 RepID=A0A438DJG3_VITVI|nr:Retrovirus-related Pol polyprotein from transposon RE1 [Vitis vinifera]